MWMRHPRDLTCHNAQTPVVGTGWWAEWHTHGALSHRRMHVVPAIQQVRGCESRRLAWPWDIDACLLARLQSTQARTAASAASVNTSGKVLLRLERNFVSRTGIFTGAAQGRPCHARPSVLCTAAATFVISSHGNGRAGPHVCAKSTYIVS